MRSIVKVRDVILCIVSVSTWGMKKGTRGLRNPEGRFFTTLQPDVYVAPWISNSIPAFDLVFSHHPSILCFQFFLSRRKFIRPHIAPCSIMTERAQKQSKKLGANSFISTIHPSLQKPVNTIRIATLVEDLWTYLLIVQCLERMGFRSSLEI